MTYKSLGVLLVAGASLLSAQNVAPGVLPGDFDIGARVRWFAKSSVGFSSQVSSIAIAGFNTERNLPKEYGPHWGGFGKRYGLSMADRSISNGLEAGFGSLWGEDPRYFRVPERPLTGRLANVFKMVFVTHNSAGNEMPAYARFVAVPSTAFISNTYRPDSENTSGDAAKRIITGLSGRILSNTLKEFWPDIRRRLGRR